MLRLGQPIPWMRREYRRDKNFLHPFSCLACIHACEHRSGLVQCEVTILADLLLIFRGAACLPDLIWWWRMRVNPTKHPGDRRQTDKFIGKNPKLADYYNALNKDELARKLMLGKMLRSEYTRGHNEEITNWVEENPGIKSKFETLTLHLITEESGKSNDDK